MTHGPARRLLLLCLGGVLVTGCLSKAPARVPNTSAPPAATPLPDSTTWVQKAVEYDVAVRQTYKLAGRVVEQQSQGRAAKSWAVVLDADETVISNVVYQAERAKLGLGYTTDSWHAWVQRREATAMPGAAAFLDSVRALGGIVAIVTNRLQSECEDTAAVFRRHALIYDAMLCRLDGSPSDKNPRFRAVAEGRSTLGTAPLDIVAFLGDNILDFPMLTQAIRGQGDPAFGDFGVRYFMFPNPMYGSWQ